MLSVDFPNQAPSSFNERDRVRKAAFKQHANAEMASNIRGRNQSYVLAYPKVDQVAGLDQHEQAFRFRRLHFGEFASKVLHKDIVKAVIELHRFLFDEFEALIQGVKNFASDEDARPQCFFNVRMLSDLTHLLKDLSAALGGLPHVAKQQDEKFSGRIDWHKYPPSGNDSSTAPRMH
jgi:hypothetical protein